MAAIRSQRLTTQHWPTAPNRCPSAHDTAHFARVLTHRFHVSHTFDAERCGASKSSVVIDFLTTTAPIPP